MRARVMRIQCEKRRGLPEREAQTHVAVDLLLPCSFDVVAWAGKVLARCPCGAGCVIVTGEE